MTQTENTAMPQLVEKPESDAEETLQFLTFYLQEEMFGLDIRPIQEICEYGKVTPVPMVPAHIRGVINLRGNVVPVIDLPVRFGWQASSVNKRSCIVIIEVETDGTSVEIGIVIDSVNEVLEIAPEAIGAPPSFGAKVRTDFISGMARVADDLIVLLNVDRVLSIDELAQLEQLTGT